MLGGQTVFPFLYSINFVSGFPHNLDIDGNLLIILDELTGVGDEEYK